MSKILVYKKFPFFFNKLDKNAGLIIKIRSKYDKQPVCPTKQTQS